MVSQHSKKRQKARRVDHNLAMDPKRKLAVLLTEVESKLDPRIMEEFLFFKVEQEMAENLRLEHENSRMEMMMEHNLQHLLLTPPVVFHWDRGHENRTRLRLEPSFRTHGDLPAPHRFARHNTHADGPAPQRHAFG